MVVINLLQVQLTWRLVHLSYGLDDNEKNRFLYNLNARIYDNSRDNT
jgi:hypothetical protein